MERIIIKNLKDFKLSHILECGQCFRWKKIEDQNFLEKFNINCDNYEYIEEIYDGVASGFYCIAISYYEENSSGEKENSAEKNLCLDLNVTGGSRDFWEDYFDLKTDYSKIKEFLLASAPELSDSIEAGYGIRILNQEIFETLISFIISQNNNITRISNCIEGLAKSFGTKIEGTDRFSFPEAEVLKNLSTEDLAPLKLGYRDKYIISSAKRFLEEGAPKDEEALLSYLGVGPKVANCIKLFGLRQMDSFPIDVWVKRIMETMYDFSKSDVKAMQKFARERFGEYGGYAQQYLFHYFRNEK